MGNLLGFPAITVPIGYGPGGDQFGQVDPDSGTMAHINSATASTAQHSHTPAHQPQTPSYQLASNSWRITGRRLLCYALLVHWSKPQALACGVDQRLRAPSTMWASRHQRGSTLLTSKPKLLCCSADKHGFSQVQQKAWYHRTYVVLNEQ